VQVLNSALQGSFIATYTDVKRGLAAIDASAINGSEILAGKNLFECFLTENKAWGHK
jgi:hypothetical protein